MEMHSSNLLRRLSELNKIGIALSREKNLPRLLETILLAAKSITLADAGTLYKVTPEGKLKFEIVRTDSLNIAMGGTTGVAIPFPDLPLYSEQGEPNNNMVVAYSVLHDTTINIKDAYSEQGFDFTGTRAFDQRTGYRSQSFLTVPLKNHENDIIGVMQLINALEPDTGKVRIFNKEDQQLVESLASQAAIALTNRQLISQLEVLFESLIKLINTAIDEKSPYTGGHCARVPELTMLLAEATNNTDEGPLADFHMNDKDRYELKIAGLLHDCGKITTPVHIVDKSTKLQTLFDRIESVDTRFEVLKRDAEIQKLHAQLAANGNEHTVKRADEQYRARLAQLDGDREFLRKANIGGEFMTAADQARVEQIGAYIWRDPNGNVVPFLNSSEMANLKIAKGTLLPEEREIINHHIVSTINMLEALPWPKHLKNVPEFAGGHHERMDGKGYPRGLTGDRMSLQARIMAIADIFEALTARDRPYKLGKTLTEALTILGRMKEDRHVDPDLFDVFIRRKVYLDYAKRFLEPYQIDEVDESRIPGYSP